MSTAVIVALIVVAVVAGLIVTLRTTARSGMPSKDVLERATQRSHQIEAEEKEDRSD